MKEETSDVYFIILLFIILEQCNPLQSLKKII